LPISGERSLQRPSLACEQWHFRKKSPLSPSRNLSMRVSG